MYNKLFSKIVDSSIWLEPTPTRIVWLMFIAVMNEDGFVQFASVANVAHRARITDEEAEQAIKILESPDANSADDENDGRRVEKVPGGWMILNASKYRDLVTREMQRAATRERVARHRSKLKGKDGNASVTPCNEVKRTCNALPSVYDYLSVLKSERVRERFKEWIPIRKAMGRKPKDWDAMFSEQCRWLSQFNEADQIESISASIRNNWQGLQPPKERRGNGARPDAPKLIDKSKIEVPERFKAWVAEHYPARREDAMKWRTWSDVPRNGLRDEWWKQEKAKLPIGDML